MEKMEAREGGGVEGRFLILGPSPELPTGIRVSHPLLPVLNVQIIKKQVLFKISNFSGFNPQ